MQLTTFNSIRQNVRDFTKKKENTLTRTVATIDHAPQDNKMLKLWKQWCRVEVENLICLIDWVKLISSVSVLVEWINQSTIK